MYDSPESLVVVTESSNRHLSPSPLPHTVATTAVRSKAGGVSVGVGSLIAVDAIICGGLSSIWAL